MKKNYFFVAILIVIAILSTFVLFACTDADTNLNDIVSEKSTKQTETQNTQKNNNQQSSNIDEDEDDSLDNGKQSSNIDDPNTQQGNTQQGNTQVGNDPQQPSIDNDPNNQQGNVDNNPNDQQSNTDNNGTTDTNPQQGNEGGGGNVNPQPQPTYVDMNVPSVGLAFADNVDGNTVSLVGIGTCEDTIIRVPASVDDKKVTRIAKDAFKGNEEITKVKLLGNVEVIEEGAFALCIKLETFYGNSDLDLVKIEDEAFYGDTELSYIPLCAYKIKEIGRNVFVGTNFYNTASNWYDDALYLQSYLIAVKPDCTGISLNYDTSAIAADAFKGCSLLPSLRISKNIVLSAGLLEDCISLTELQLHSIGSANENTAKLSYLFGEPENKDNCVLVDGAYIPKSLTTIAVLSGNVGQEAFKDCTFIKEVYASGEIIGNNAFNNCTGLREIYLGSATKTIGQYAFYGCTSLVRINFYKKLESIGQYAFYGCESLRQIVLPENLESIGNYAFSECTKLTSVTLPTTLQIIGMKAFYNCDCLIEVCNLSALEIEKGQSDCGYVGYYAYDIYTTKTYTSKFEYSHDCLLYKKGTNDYEFIKYTGNSDEVFVQYGVTSMRATALRGLSKIKKLTLASTLDAIPEGALYGCSSLESIVIPFVGDVDPRTAGSNREQAFGYIFGKEEFEGSVAIEQKECTGHASIRYSNFYIPSSLRSVKVQYLGRNHYDAFMNCTMLTSIEIGLGTLVKGALNNCKSLETLILDQGLDCTVKELFGSSMSSATKEGFVTIRDGSTYYFVPESLKHIEFGSALSDDVPARAFSDLSMVESIEISSWISEIGEGAFAGCSSLKSLSLPFPGDKAYSNTDTDVKTFGYLFGTSSYEGSTPISQRYYNPSSTAWFGSTHTYYLPTSLESVTLSYCKYIQYGAFNGCSMIKNITISTAVTEFGDYAFSGCSGLESLIIPEKVNTFGAFALANNRSLTTITIPDGTEVIPEALFNNTAVETVYLPHSITSLGKSAFWGCTKLSEVVFDGSIAEWESITRGETFDKNVPSTCVVHCTDGDTVLNPAPEED